ncbi:MAG: phosphoribosylformylglycinamidine synthase [bacterium]|nr:phosphoribosylformylglycinamidine synthase [bacterium]
MNARIFVEKKIGYQTEALSLLDNFKTNLKADIDSLRLINIYDVFNIKEEVLEKAKYSIFGEIVTDNVFTDIDLSNKLYFAVEYLPGQFDQRADSAMQCIRLLNPASEAIVKSARLIILEGKIKDLTPLKKYYINEVESREKDMSKLELPKSVHNDEKYEVEGFNEFNNDELKAYLDKLGLAMSIKDLAFVQDYFKTQEKRNPTITEIRMLDTYWSDHCRHTTFETELKSVKANDDFINLAYEVYLDMRKYLGRESKPITLMDMATVNARYESKRGNLEDQEKSEENNACSVYVDVLVDGVKEKWLMMFKNETHNHPTEIEPFGGASTCIGGAIRDPLSGRSYVYQAMRVTGAGNITKPIEETLANKLPQKNISKTAAAGYSSYGNQIGLATTHVREIYHDGYVAKRLEVGAVVGAIKADMIRRESPKAGDIIIMFGGRTGRDGIGGATGSSKEHTEKSLELCSSEVQKGNAPEERKIQRLFRNPEVVKMIKKSNDFGAGGVSVAIGELADGLVIDLDKVKVKYDGLNATELAISESQERMSVVVEPKDVDRFIECAKKENIECTVIAKVTDNNRLVMKYKGQDVVNISRDFINTNGVRQESTAIVDKIDFSKNPFERKVKDFKENLKDLNVTMQKGLIEMFDATIGATTVLMPFGGKYQLTETQVSAQKFPVLEGETTTTSVMAFGYNPYIMSWSPYHGANYSVVESLTKLTCAAIDYKNVRFSFQEYFEKLGSNPNKWGKVTSAMLGSIDILKKFELASIGGKDSMSGTFKDLNVPPTLIAFGIATTDSSNIISPEFKAKGNKLYLIKHNPLSNYLPNVDELKKNFDYVRTNILNKQIVSAWSIGNGGLAEGLAKCSFGNKLGCNVNTNLDIYAYDYGSILVESTKELDGIYLGEVTNDSNITINGKKYSIDECIKANLETFESIYPTKSKDTDYDLSICKETVGSYEKLDKKYNDVKVIIPAFPGTNCDYDTYRAFKKAGGNPEIFVFRNTTETDVLDSINELAEKIKNAQILVISGGFSAGDEPDGSGKFISNVLCNETIKAEVKALLKRKGLVLGICNGFQALIKSGIFFDYKLDSNSPTLFRNDINRHISHIAHTKVVTNKSPWLSSFEVGSVYEVAMSHGEGKFVVSKELAKEFFDNGMVAFQYVDEDGRPTNDTNYNVNGSNYAIEGIISKDGLVLGKMGHSERKGIDVFKNIYGNKDEDIFKNAINYFKGK